MVYWRDTWSLATELAVCVGAFADGCLCLFLAVTPITQISETIRIY